MEKIMKRTRREQGENMERTKREQGDKTEKHWELRTRLSWFGQTETVYEYIYCV
jgi:helix-turn-helix protein